MLAGLLCTLVIAQGAVARESGRVEPGGSWSLPVAASPRDRLLSIVVSLDQPGHLAAAGSVQATVRFGDGTHGKRLHGGDPDLTVTYRQPAGQAGAITLDADRALERPAAFVVGVVELTAGDDDAVAFEAEPNDTPQTANPLTLGRTVYGLADDRPEFPQGDLPTEAESTAGRDWFRFDYDGDTPSLVDFGLEFVDRDVPPDVRIYQLKDGQPVEYTQGIDPQSLQREKPPRPGANKFTTRVLTKGTYYVLVDACHPEYQLRTRRFPVPPYLKGDAATPEAVADAARQAVRTALPFQLASGDSWHANTPRRGHPTDRVANPHHETSTCLACHPTHFTTQSAIEAIGNGYANDQPFALQFLTERLANNPVPLYGHDGAVWARMIPAPANVLGRLSTIVMDAEELLGGPHRDILHGEIAAFLKLYYEGRETIAPDESNGNNPVSRYKVAADAWRQLDAIGRRTDSESALATRDLVGKLITTGEPSNTRDLAAQTIGLCRIDKQVHADRIAANCKRLLELQRPDGNWSVKFEPDAAITEMQTGESLFALALAGYGADHPAVRRGVVALLKSQDEFGGWLDPNPYEQFRTPFRETQWALMALSRLYPGPAPRDAGRTGWDGPLGPQVNRLRTESAATIIRDLETIWDPIDTDLAAQVLREAQAELPLVRFAACNALGRVGDRTAVATLVGRLGDESKLVRRAAAEALRRIGNRLNASQGPTLTLDQVHFVTAIEAALESPDDRTRRGATRLFAAHFRDLSRETDLADALLKRLDDGDPVVAMQAVKGLWRWWYWTSDLALRERIEDAFLVRIGTPAHRWVRRNLTEALYILADENIRYLFNHWTPALAKEADRERVIDAQHATVNRLGRKFVAAIEGGNALQRDGALRALSEFHERPAVREGRIGNDTEPTLFYDEAVPAVASALVRTLDHADPTTRRLALQGLITVRGSKDATLARAVLARLGDADAGVREWAGLQLKEFPVAVTPGRADPPLDAVIAGLATSDQPEGRAAALGVLGRWGPVDGTEHAALVRQGLTDPAPAVRTEALAALGRFEALRAEADTARTIREALADPAVSPRLAALRLALDHRGLVPEKALKAALEDATPAHRSALLEAIAGSKPYAADLRLVGVVADSLADADRGVRERALQAIQAHPTLVQNPAVAEALTTLAASDNARQRDIATALLKTRGQSSGADASAEGLDLAFFRARVLPVLATASEDGQSCVGCHRSHTILRLVGPDDSGAWTDDRVRANYRSALRVVNLVNPASSLLLRKPTWESAEEAEAQNDPNIEAHSGGVRFEADSDSYRVLLDWINGARLKPAAAPGGP